VENAVAGWGGVPPAVEPVKLMRPICGQDVVHSSDGCSAVGSADGSADGSEAFLDQHVSCRRARRDHHRHHLGHPFHRVRLLFLLDPHQSHHGHHRNRRDHQSSLVLGNLVPGRPTPRDLASYLCGRGCGLPEAHLAQRFLQSDSAARAACTCRGPRPRRRCT
jgi:hypothetical protein